MRKKRSPRKRRLRKMKKSKTIDVKKLTIPSSFNFENILI